MLEKKDVERVLIVDWDVHHGSATQHMFEDDPSVFYFSIHEWPFYPGTGAMETARPRRGEGTTLNVPAPGMGDRYLRTFRGGSAPTRATSSRTSSSSRRASMRTPPTLSPGCASRKGYRGMTREVMNRGGCCDGRLVSFSRGGTTRARSGRSPRTSKP